MNIEIMQMVVASALQELIDETNNNSIKKVSDLSFGTIRKVLLVGEGYTWEYLRQAPDCFSSCSVSELQKLGDRIVQLIKEG